MIFTNELIAELISCPKRLTEAPKVVAPRKSSSKTEFRMESQDGKYSFGGYITQNSSFQENFSIGLIFYPREEKGRFCLLRCNGLHGEHISAPHHSYCHQHTVDADDLNNGIKVERYISRVGYATVEDAIQYYIRHINLRVEDRQKYFPPPGSQPEFPFDNKDLA